jgi:hypothetical protein
LRTWCFRGVCYEKCFIIGHNVYTTDATFVQIKPIKSFVLNIMKPMDWLITIIRCFKVNIKINNVKMKGPLLPLPQPPPGGGVFVRTP